jgi:hypothetical protein
MIWSSVSQTVVLGCSPSGPQALSEEKALQKLYHAVNELKNTPFMSVLKLPLLADLQQKVGELVISLTSCPTSLF